MIQLGSFQPEIRDIRISFQRADSDNAGGKETVGKKVGVK